MVLGDADRKLRIKAPWKGAELDLVVLLHHNESIVITRK